MTGGPRLRSLDVACCTIPTDRPESDGTFTWDATTIVIVQIGAADRSGLGYSYTDASAADVIRSALWPTIEGFDAFSTPRCWQVMRERVRNTGSRGIAANAVSAVDTALWDLKARLLDTSLVSLLGAARDAVPVYGSGGFTSYTDRELAEQLGGWVNRGIERVKMKVGRDPATDPHRVAIAREAIGDDAQLFVDANGAYARKQALVLAEEFAERSGVSWFEEPVSSDDLDGLRLLRDRAPAGMEIAAGEYGYDVGYFERIIHAGAVDVVQVDATRVGGYSGLLAAAAVAEAHELQVSGHCAPALHAPVLACVRNLRHLEYFHDHVRIEHLLFDGVAPLIGGDLRPDPGALGTGLTLRRMEVERYAA